MAKRILLIEDEVLISNLYEKIFAGEGYEVDKAGSGKEGLSKIMQRDYDLVLLDIVLPDLDGIGVLKALKENPPSAGVPPILVLTALDIQSSTQSAMELGAKEYLIKSKIKPKEILSKVKLLIG